MLIWSSYRAQMKPFHAICSTPLNQLIHLKSHCCTTSWKTAASLILVFDDEVHKKLSLHVTFDSLDGPIKNQDFNVLLLKRPTTMRSFAGKVAFPGGIISPIDFSSSLWSSDLKQKFSMNLIKSSQIAPMYKALLRQFPSHTDPSNYLTPSIGLRLCALREVFEETGFLLYQFTDCMTNNQSIPTTSVFLLEPDETKQWQTEILKDPSLFPKLYEQLDLIPPVGALMEWSNWMTPAIYPPRFDTLFFLTTVHFVNASHTSGRMQLQNDEATHLYAGRPSAFLPASRQVMVPPQAYELGRLAQYTHLQGLSAFAFERAHLGSRRWVPVMANLSIAGQQCRVFFLPGDQRYEEVANCGTSEKTYCASELAQDVERNRMIVCQDTEYSWFDSNVYESGHVTPVSREEYAALVQSSAKS